MTNNSFSSQGTILARGDGATPTEAFAPIGQITQWSGPGGKAAVIDASNLASSAKEKVLGLMDPGQMSLTIQLDSTSAAHKGLIADQLARVKRNFKMTLSDVGATVITFSAFVSDFTIDGAVDKLVEAKVTLELTGVTTYVWPS